MHSRCAEVRKVFKAIRVNVFLSFVTQPWQPGDPHKRDENASELRDNRETRQGSKANLDLAESI